MRKASREMDAAFALEVLDKAPYITVSFTRADGTPYGVPLSLARTDEKTFYFHCALERLIQQWHCRQLLAAHLLSALRMAALRSNINLQWLLARLKL